ncbi:hypothetical protein Q4F19_15420 [Sphingomonas sp. BIUV-7]|uniref:PDZ domain-containing protein n=1 Tax=Sphingomonas natans TaxID=3063330 RepID=A0ABT8YBT4_9SPHN|nr:hypothetical protein [Sphingomonas sp. BIUV-7]MDO6415780.1 hypothetical protein [Sphingomonas sp. BIUV-7]
MPQLRGGVLTAYRVLMIALLLIALPGFVAAFLQQRDAQGSVGASFAAGLRFPGGTDLTTRVAPFSDEARIKGVRPGDKLIAIDGRSFDAFDFDRLQALLAGPDGSTYQLTIQTEAQPPRTIRLTRSSHYMAQAYEGSGLTFARRNWTVFGFRMLDAALALAAAVLLFIRRPTDPVAAMLALSAVPLGDGLAYLWPGGGDILYGFSVVRHMLFLTALLIYPDGRLVPRWAFWLTPLIPAIELVSFHATSDEAAIPLRQLLFFGFVLAAIVAFTIRYKTTPPGTQRQQIKFVMLGAAAWAGFGLVALALERMSAISVSVPAAAWYSLASHLAESLAAMALEAGILVSLMRYRLYDADALISRSAVYTMLTVMIGPAFAASDKIVQVFSAQFFGESARAMSAGFGAAIAASLVVPLHRRARAWTENRFQKQLVDFREDLPKFVGDLRVIASLGLLMGGVVKRIEQGVRASQVAIILRSDTATDAVWSSRISEEDVRGWWRDWRPATDAPLDCDRGDAVFPVRVPLREEGAGVVGWILLGPRPDGSFYGKGERAALAEIADPVARAIRVVRERDARAAAQAELNAALERRIALLERRLFERSADEA